MRSWVIGLAVALLSFGAAAQSPEERAKERFEEAQRQYAAGEYERALALYQEVYLFVHSPALLFNMAQCQRLLGRREEAILLYRQFLAEVPDTPYRAEVEERIRELEAPPDPPATLPSPAPSPPAQAPEAGPRSPLPWYAGAAALGGASLGAGLAAVSKLRDIPGLDDKQDLAENRALLREARLRAGIADGLLVAAVLAGAQGVRLSVKQRQAEAGAREARLILAPQGAALQLRF